MTVESLSMVAGVVLSLVWSYIPGAQGWFDKLAPNYKRLVMLASLLVVAGGVFGLACMGRLDAVACDGDGAWQLVELFVLAAVANQGAYMLTPKS